jgi:hypothetical protein
MLRKVVGALFVLAVCFGITMAGETIAVIKKVDGNKVTFAESKGKGETGPEQTLSVADNVKVLKGKFNKDTKAVEAGDAIEGGLKNEMFGKINPEKGMKALVVTDDGSKKITEIRIMGGGKKKKDN